MLTPCIPTVRQMMPEGYLAKLVARTNNKNYSYLAQLVRHEHTTSKHWPAILSLAEETDPAGFAAWSEAYPDKLPAKQAA